MTTIAARPTVYAGIQMRSRLEAGYAAWLDKSGKKWRYEPQCFASPRGQYLPDFRLETSEGGYRYVEIKPTSILSQPEALVTALRRMTIIRDSEPDARVSLLSGDLDARGDFRSTGLLRLRAGGRPFSWFVHLCGARRLPLSPLIWHDDEDDARPSQAPPPQRGNAP